MKTSITKWGNSQGVRLPKSLLNSVSLSDSDIVEITAENNRIIIKKAEEKRKHKSIQERFKHFSGEYEPIEIDWGDPVGEEIW